MTAHAYGLYLRDRAPEGEPLGSIALCQACIEEISDELDEHDFYGVPEGTPCMRCASNGPDGLRQLMEEHRRKVDAAAVKTHRAVAQAAREGRPLDDLRAAAIAAHKAALQLPPRRSRDGDDASERRRRLNAMAVERTYGHERGVPRIAHHNATMAVVTAALAWWQPSTLGDEGLLSPELQQLYDAVKQYRGQG